MREMMGGAKQDQIRQDELGWHPDSEKYVCGDCLDDYALAEVVNKHLASNKCDFCGREEPCEIAADVNDVTEHMATCISRVYTDPVNVLPLDREDETGYFTGLGGPLDAFELLEEVGFAPSSPDLLEEVASAFSDHDWCKHDHFLLDEHDRFKYGWEAFKKAIKHYRRYTFWTMRGDEPCPHPDDMPPGYVLAEIGAAIKRTNLVKSLASGASFWRVRVCDRPLREACDVCPPPVNLATQANRMSPAGIAMFYGADDLETAKLETVDASASKAVGTGVVWRSVRQLRLLDLVDLPESPSFFDLGRAETIELLSFLKSFAVDLAQPIARDGCEHIEYTPTQAFTEYVRFEMDAGDHPIDGIRYRSSRRGGGVCSVLFCGRDECLGEDGHGRKVDRWLEMDAFSLCRFKVGS